MEENKEINREQIPEIRQRIQVPLETVKKFLIIIGVIILISGIGIFTYEWGYEEGANAGASAGINYGANALAGQMCETNQTFKCQNGKICGCFMINNQMVNQSGG